MEELRDLLLTRYPKGITLRILRKNHNRSDEFVDRILKAFPSIFELKDYQPRSGPSTKLLILRRSSPGSP
jgi:hypothetical protein